MKKYFCFLLLACGRNKYDLVDKSLQFEEIKNTFEVAKEHQLLAYFYDGDNPYLLYLSTILNQQKFCLTAEDILFKEHYIILDQIDRLDAVFAFASVTLLNLGRKDMESSLWKLEGMRIEKVALENDPFAWLRPNAVIEVGNRFYFKHLEKVVYLERGSNTAKILEMTKDGKPLAYTRIVEMRTLRLHGNFLVIRMEESGKEFWAMYDNNTFTILENVQFFYEQFFDGLSS